MNYTKTALCLSAATVALLFTSCDNDDDESVITGTIDLEATSITFSIEKETEFTGTATITGTITNIGTANYESEDGKQSLLLYEKQLGTSGSGTLVNQINFTNLAAGASTQITYTRDWNSSSSAEGEFAPDYILTISYDPDILLDGNNNNDDNNLSNNSIEESGYAINDLFRE